MSLSSVGNSWASIANSFLLRRPVLQILAPLLTLPFKVPGAFTFWSFPGFCRINLLAACWPAALQVLGFRLSVLCCVILSFHQLSSFQDVVDFYCLLCPISLPLSFFSSLPSRYWKGVEINACDQFIIFNRKPSLLLFLGKLLQSFCMHSFNFLNSSIFSFAVSAFMIPLKWLCHRSPCWQLFIPRGLIWFIPFHTQCQVSPSLSSH